MLRVPNVVLLCALGSRAGMAVRQSLKVSEPGLLANALGKIGALIQSNQHSDAQTKVLDNIQMIAAGTPGQPEALHAALSNVIAEIKANVDRKITGGFADTQAAIVAAINKLEAATTSALTQKATADEADRSWFECVRVEKSMRLAFEKAVVAEGDANLNLVKPCADQEGSKIFDKSVETPSLACDFQNGDTCAHQFDAYTTMLNGMVDGIASKAAEASATWNNFKNDCDAAKAHAADMMQARIEADKLWSAQSETCQSRHESRQLGLCSFGTALQNKCEKVGSYRSLIEEVDAVNGGPNSEPDRQAEWHTTQVTKCMLQNVIDGIDLDSGALGACELAVNYAELVGHLDKMQSQFATQTSETSFSCNEQSIIFNNGEFWGLPQGLAPAASEYIIGSFRPQVNLAKGTSPFTFCDGAPVAPPLPGAGRSAGPGAPEEQPAPNSEILFQDSFETPSVLFDQPLTSVHCIDDVGGCVSDAWVNPSHPNYVKIASKEPNVWDTPFGRQAMKVFGYQRCPNKQPCGAETGPNVLTETLTEGSTYTLTFNVAAAKEHGDYQVELAAVDEQGQTKPAHWAKTTLAFKAGSTDTHDFSHTGTVTYTATNASPLGLRLAIRLLDADQKHWSETPLFDNIKLVVTRAR